MLANHPIISAALKERANSPIQTAVYGAGFLGNALAGQILNHTPGMNIPIICNRNIDAALGCFTRQGLTATVVETASKASSLIARGQYCVTDDPTIALEVESIDVVAEVTGSSEYAASVAVDAICLGKHVVVNAEVDGTVGPLLAHKARSAGVVFTGCDGDQPGVTMNLLSFIESIGGRPLVAGNIKGLLDNYRTPDTQRDFAKEWDMSPYTATSFADGSKIAYEQAIVANATGFTVPQLGMNGFSHPDHIDKALTLYDHSSLVANGPIVDFVVGAQPGPGVYVFADFPDKSQARYLEYLKMGEGPLYSFYRPYHLTHFEFPTSIARAVLFGDPTIAPFGPPVAQVVATAKRNLLGGDTLDDLGGFDVFGLCANSSDVSANSWLLQAQAPGCTLLKSVPAGTPISIKDVEIPPGRLTESLLEEQSKVFC